MNTSILELSYFLEVVNSASITHASKKLGISQPALTMSIQRLEKAIGAPLLVRHVKGVTLTEAGKQFMSHAKELMEKWQTIKEYSQEAYQKVQGKIKLGCHLSVGFHCLEYIIPGLVKEHPKLEVNIIHGFSYNLINQILDLEVDIGILVNPIKHPDLVIRKLYSDYDTFWISSSRKKSDYLSDVILCDPNRTQTQELLKKSKKSGIHYNRMITSSSLEVLAKLTAKGCGIGILPALVVVAISPDQLISLKSAPIAHDEICLVYRPENKNVKATQVVAKAINNFFQTLNT